MSPGEVHRVEHSSGLWNSITGADFDEDGDIDYICGNLGLNGRLRASADEPVCIYAKDFDRNGRLDPVMCYYVEGKNYIYPTRDEMIVQMNAIRARFPTYREYASVTFEESFMDEEINDAYILKAECLESSYFENKGNGSFERRSLPREVQFGPVFGLITEDINGDGHTDILLAGNSYATEASTGRFDALSGLLLTGNGKGDFMVSKSNETGFTADRSVKGMAKLTGDVNRRLILVANNNAAMEAYRYVQHASEIIRLDKGDQYILLYKNNGDAYKQEVYHGGGYLSQSSNAINPGKEINRIIIFHNNGTKREVKLHEKYQKK
jgi:hypothetical protein